MTRKEIDDVVCAIMRKDGQDRHVDRHDVITSFIVSLINGEEQKWIENYNSGEKIKPQNCQSKEDGICNLPLGSCHQCDPLF